MNIKVKIGDVEVVVEDIAADAVMDMEALIARTIKATVERAAAPEKLEQTATDVILHERQGEWRMMGQRGSGFAVWSAPLHHTDVDNYLKRGAKVTDQWGGIHPAHPDKHPWKNADGSPRVTDTQGAEGGPKDGANSDPGVAGPEA